MLIASCSGPHEVASKLHAVATTTRMQLTDAVGMMMSCRVSKFSQLKTCCKDNAHQT